MNNKNNKPIIGISIGDVNGIGPELIMNVFSDNRMSKICTPVIYGNGKVFSFYKKLLNANNFYYNQCKSIQDIQHSKVNVITVQHPSFEVTMGQPTEESGSFAFESLKSAVTDLKQGNINALVTCPINKKFIQNEDFDFPGHTEYLAREIEGDSLMFMVSDDLRVALVTAHTSIASIAKRLSKDAIIKKVNLLIKSLKRDFGISKPKIAVLGLNPHAGEAGLLGSEEIDIIQPAIKHFEDQNAIVLGPFPADGFFGNYNFKSYDAVLAMYHDQGLIPFKTIAFNKGVNFTAGLEAVRTSPDHGTAYDMVGKGKVNSDSFRESIYKAIEILKTRNGEEAEKEPLFEFSHSKVLK